MTRRVVVTGMAGVSPLGSSWAKARETLRAGRSCIHSYDDWSRVEGLQTRLGAPVTDFQVPTHYSRKKIRSMGRVSLLATRATEMALEDAGLQERDDEMRCGLAYGSTSGSPPAMQKYAQQITVNKTLAKVRPVDFLKFMSHTTLSNLAQFFGIRGRLIPSCSACTSSSQALGFAYEAIKYGKAEVMIAGGSEELDILSATVFDIMYATSTRNEEPQLTPRPFDKERDGLVVGEGAGTLILEALEHANQRGARIYAEIVGFATNCDGAHIVTPTVEGMRTVMQLALQDAAIEHTSIDYVNAHGTATEVGDIAESRATAEVFGAEIAISSLKSYMGHTLGACGALEAWLSIHMMREGWLAPTLNLDTVDERCAALDYVTEVREQETEYMMTNNFAFGGVNTSIILKKWKGEYPS